MMCNSFRHLVTIVILRGLFVQRLMTQKRSWTNVPATLRTKLVVYRSDWTMCWITVQYPHNHLTFIFLNQYYASDKGGELSKEIHGRIIFLIFTIYSTFATGTLSLTIFSFFNNSSSDIRISDSSVNVLIRTANLCIQFSMIYRQPDIYSSSNDGANR